MSAKKIGSVDIATHIVERPSKRPKGKKAFPSGESMARKNRAKRVRGPLTHRPFAEALKGIRV